jgi:hypothetical protein
MNKFEVIPHRYWFNRTTGARASLYGAAPWTNDAEAQQWERVIDGWTIRNNQTGTIGTARTPVASIGEAHALIRAMGGNRTI